MQVIGAAQILLHRLAERGAACDVERGARAGDGRGDEEVQRVGREGGLSGRELEANLATKHGVPAVDEAGSSGSIVFRSITDRVKWSQLEKKLAKFYADKAKKPAKKSDKQPVGKKRRRE